MPEAMAEDNNGEPLFVAGETTAECHAHLRNVEEVGGGRLAPHALRLAIAADGGREEFVVSSDAGEGFRLVAHVGVERPGKVIAALFAVVREMQTHERGGIAHGRRTQDKPADHGKDGGVGGDAEADGDDDGEHDTG